MVRGTMATTSGDGHARDTDDLGLVADELGQLGQGGRLIGRLDEPPEAVPAHRAARQRGGVAQRAGEAAPRPEGPAALVRGVVVGEQEGRHRAQVAGRRRPRTSGNPLVLPPQPPRSRARPIVPATATRPDTPSFPNTFVRWLSIVFSLRNSSAAISRLV